MQGADDRTPLSQRVYEFIRTRGCATIEEVARAVNVSPTKTYTAIRSLIARRLVLPYRFQIGRERIYCIPDVGDKLYGRKTRLNTSGLICITLPVDLIEFVDETATRMGETRSGLIRQALMQYLEMATQYSQQEEPQTNIKHSQQEEPQKDEGPDFIVPIR